MSSTPTIERVRLTISVTPEVHEAFTRLARAGSMSISRAMGDWLEDTVEAVDFMAQKMEEARSAPKQVVREMHAYALGLADEAGALMEDLRRKAASERAGKARQSLPSEAVPPSSNTGGKVPRRASASKGSKP